MLPVEVHITEGAQEPPAAVAGPHRLFLLVIEAAGNPFLEDPLRLRRRLHPSMQGRERLHHQLALAIGTRLQDAGCKRGQGQGKPASGAEDGVHSRHAVYFGSHTQR